MERTCCVQKLFLTFRTIYVHNMFSPCSAKIRAFDKDLPVKDGLNQHRRNQMCVGGSKEIYCDICIPQVEFKSPTIFIRYESNGCVKLFMEMGTV